MSTRVYSGVIVSWVDPQGPAAELVNVTDVITAVGDQPLSSLEQWEAVASRLLVGQTLAVRIQRGDRSEVVTLTAGSTTQGEPPPLGLTMRSTPAGIQVADVAPGSAAARAGLRAGDLITVFGDDQTPTPAEVRRTYAAAPGDRPLLVAVTRGKGHLVLTLQNR
jgi:S1-C subfamily serine protease